MILRFVPAALLLLAAVADARAQTPPAGAKADPAHQAQAAEGYAQAMLHQAVVAEAMLKAEQDHVAALEAQIADLNRQLAEARKTASAGAAQEKK